MRLMSGILTLIETAQGRLIGVIIGIRILQGIRSHQEIFEIQAVSRVREEVEMRLLESGIWLDRHWGCF